MYTYKYTPKQIMYFIDIFDKKEAMNLKERKESTRQGMVVERERKNDIMSK